MRLRRFELPASRLWSHCQSSYSMPETDGVLMISVMGVLVIAGFISASAERSFSMARRLRTWLRSNIKQAVFNNLALLSFHKQRADTMSLLEITNDFVNNENRHRNFGKFTLTDLY